MRVEDTDQERSSIESVKAIMDAMKWLGLDWDEGPDVGGAYGPYFQSDRKDRYRAVSEELIAKGMAYRCYCTKEDLDAQRAALKATDPKAQFVYPRTCRERKDNLDLPFVVRFKTPDTGSTDFNDLVFKSVSTPNSQQQDFVILRRNGLPLYNLGCVVDDHDMLIDLVARGRDHIGNTPQQVLLYRALAWETPKFAHLPMMLSKKGEKLSKRHAAVSVAEYRERGFTPNSVLNYLVRFGWSFGDQEIFTRKQLIESFSWDRVGRADGKFDEKKFADVAFEHLKNPELTDDATYVRGTLPFLEQRGLEPDADVVGQALPLIRERARSYQDAAFHLDFYLRRPPEFDEKAQRKFLVPSTAPKLAVLASWLGEQLSLDPNELEAHFKSWVEAQGWSLKEIAQPARVALTGRSNSPGLFDVMKVLGKQESIRRLEQGAALASAAESTG